MRHAPARLVERLDRLFDGELRVRWSQQRGEWHIEHKVGRGRAAGFYVSGHDDNAIRAQDGYTLVLAIRTGDRMPCPRCGHDMPVPVRKLAESRCQECTRRGLDGRYPAAFFDLDGDSLIEHLSKINPKNTWRKDMHKQADLRNAQILASKEREFANTIAATTHENYNQLVGIQSVGYTGKVYTGAQGVA